MASVVFFAFEERKGSWKASRGGYRFVVWKVESLAISY